VIPGSRSTVGTCGSCGGRVSVPTVWMSVVPPVPMCETCGATARPDHGPVVPMNPPMKLTYGTNTTSIGTGSPECCVR
jgi:hypothetical protein